MRRKFNLIAAILFIVVCTLFVSLSACKPRVSDEKEFTVTVVGGTGGGVFKENSVCTVTATVGEGFEFVEWLKDGVSVSKDVSYSFTVVSDVTLSAVTKVKEKEPEPPEPLNLGAFARKWIGKEQESGILDLEIGTWSIWNEFEIVSVSGEGKNTVINCVADGMSFNAAITDDGELKVTDAEFDELFYLFMPAADSFNGLWALTDDDVYVLFISELNEERLFGWALVNSDGSIDDDYLITATTELIFDDENNACLQIKNAYDITYYINGDGNLAVAGEDLIYVPTANMFENCYVADGGKLYGLNIKNSKITVNGEELPYQLKQGTFGVGAYFLVGDASYALIQTLDGVALYSDSGSELLKPFDVFRYNGEWQGRYSLSISNGAAATLNGRTAPLTTVTEDGITYLSFTINNSVYTIYPVGESSVSLYLGCSNEADNGYYVSASIPSKFEGVYSDGVTSLKVSQNLTVTVGSDVYSDGVLTVLPNLDRVEAVAPAEFVGLQQIAIAFDNSDKYLIWIKDGVAIVTDADGGYTVQASYYLPSALQTHQSEFLSGLSSSTDKYTTGGVNRITVELDFVNGNIIVDGKPSTFVWQYAIKSTGDEYAAIAFQAEVSGIECNCLLYPYFDYDYVRMETKPVGSSSKAIVHSLVSLNLYEQLLGTSYFASRDGYADSIEFCQDGTIVLTEGKDGVGQRFTDYELTREEKTGVLIATFVEHREIAFIISVYCDNIGISVQMIDSHFVNEALIDLIGIYVDESGLECLQFLSDARYKFSEQGLSNVKLAKSFESITVDEDKIICVYSDGVMVFENGIASVTDFNGKNSVYTKKDGVSQEVTQVPSKFIGEYCDSDGRVFVEVLADNMFLYNTDGDGIIGSTQAVKFDKVTIDGGTVTCEKVYSNQAFSWKVTFVFEGDSVTVYDTDNDPVTYLKRA